MRNKLKGINAVAGIAIIVLAYSITDWFRVLFEPSRFAAHFDAMNSNGMLFTPESLRINAIGTILIDLVGVVGAILIIGKKRVGRRLFVLSYMLFPAYNVMWVVINSFMGLKIGLFVSNIILGSVIYFFVLKLLNRPSMREHLEAN